MRRFLIRAILIPGGALVLIAGLWFFTSRCFALARRVLAWPTPLLQVNFMTGYVPSWQRNLYYRLSWAKASGARLDILWRLRQDYDAVNGWTGGRLTDLIRIEIRPATGLPVVWVETSQ